MGLTISGGMTFTPGFSMTTPSPTYSASISGGSNFQENSVIIANISTTNVANGTTLYWTQTGTVNSSVFNDGVTSGSFSITNNSGSVGRQVVPTLTASSSYTYNLQIRTGSVSGPVVATTGSVNILGPAYDLLSPSNTSPTSTDSVTFNFNGQNIPDGTRLYWTNSGTATGSDFTGTGGLNNGFITVYSNNASLNITFVSSSAGKTFIMQLRTDSTSGTIVKTASTVTVQGGGGGGGTTYNLSSFSVDVLPPFTSSRPSLQFVSPSDASAFFSAAPTSITLNSTDGTLVNATYSGCTMDSLGGFNVTLLSSTTSPQGTWYTGGTVTYGGSGGNGWTYVSTVVPPPDGPPYSFSCTMQSSSDANALVSATSSAGKLVYLWPGDGNKYTLNTTGPSKLYSSTVVELQWNFLSSTPDASHTNYIQVG